MTDQAALRRQRLTGIALMCSAVALFSCLDTTAKYLLGYMDALQVVGVRYFGALILAMIFLNPVNKPGMMVTRRPWLQIGRSTLLLGSTAFNFLAFRYLQLDEALSILFATPFIVAIMSGPLLGETVGMRRWIAISVGFFGVLLVTRPGFGGIHWAALLSLGSTLCYSLYSITTRLLSRTDSNETTLFYTNLVGAAVMVPVTFLVWTTPHSLFIIGLMVLSGALGGFGHYLLICAHRLAPASTLSPFIYTQMIGTSSLGFLVFGDVPHFWTIAGGIIVVGSGLYLLNHERKSGRTVPDPVIPE